METISGKKRIVNPLVWFRPGHQRRQSRGALVTQPRAQHDAREANRKSLIT